MKRIEDSWVLIGESALEQGRGGLCVREGDGEWVEAWRGSLILTDRVAAVWAVGVMPHASRVLTPGTHASKGC